MFKGKLVDQICEASGGDFNALVEDLVGALDKFSVPQHEKDQLLGALDEERHRGKAIALNERFT